MAKSYIAIFLVLLLEAAAEDDQTCNDSRDEVALLAHTPRLGRWARRVMKRARGGVEHSGRLAVGDAVGEDGFCCWWSPDGSCSDCPSRSGPNDCGGPCGPDICPADPSSGAGFWCGAPPSPTPTPSPSPSPSPTPSPTPPHDTLEACLKGPGGSPHTYVGESQYRVDDYSVDDIHNARVTKSIKPSAVVFATEESHVVRALSCAFKFGKPAYGRSGMNQYEASCADEAGGDAGCILIDTNNMWQIGWPSTGCQHGEHGCVVPLGPGLSLGTAYASMSSRGYTLPAGTCAQVRVAGLTLGGGKGWLTRKYGMTLDRLRAIDAVLLNGTKVHADSVNEAHLFWLARGGGGNIFPGVVTAFYFELVPMPASPASYSMTWPANYECRSTVLAQWYKKMAMHSDNDLWARATLSNFGTQQLKIDVVYIGQDKESAKQLLWEVNSAACGQGQLTGDTPNDSWINIVLNSNDPQHTTKSDLDKNNCGWDLSGTQPRRTKCYGYGTEYDLKWAYRSLVFGKGGEVSQDVWNALATQDMYNNFFIEIDPTNGFTATIPSDATAYPHRDAGFIMMQVVMRGSDVTGQMAQSAALLTSMTQHVPALGYYNYLDKNMDQYGGVPRDAYYDTNADTVEAYLKEYTEGISLPNGCARCNSWEIRSS